MTSPIQWHNYIVMYIFLMPIVFLFLPIRTNSELGPHSFPESPDEIVEGRTPRPVVSDPTYCARLQPPPLHLHRLHSARIPLQNLPPITTTLETTLFPRFSTLHPDFFSNIADLYSHPFHILLSQLQTNSPYQWNPPPPPLSPVFAQPDPDLFIPAEGYSSLFEIYFEEAMEERRCLGIWVVIPPHDEGVVLDVDTLKAVWHYGLDRLPEYPCESWVLLQVVLEKELAKWERGEYYFNEERMSVQRRGWTQLGLEETIAVWEGLLRAIESGGARKEKWDEPLSFGEDDIQRYEISLFAKGFLSRAKRPRFNFIGSGITVFLPESWAEVYGAEGETSKRRKTSHWGEEEPGWPTLVFPSVDELPTTSDDPKVPEYLKRPHADSMMVDRRTRVYILPWDLDYHGGARLYGGSNQVIDEAMIFDQACPWGPGRTPRLVEILRHWNALVESGPWRANSDGVAEDLMWFIDNKENAKLTWR
ncbi:hypothetical protein QBC36DRAFT_353534 [Triangularia setosa]|uniref:Uncharacterized protein n=1 Tax=Triangularia setosa TaxID=2587417 RepID=A0AAN7A796_9PEZI|nr:hypothetical protein QBC36DRAFT_353534 [Podospora setosa]